MSCSKPKVKDVEHLEDLDEIYELAKAFGVPTKDAQGKNDLKSRLKEFVKKEKSQNAWSQTEFSSVILEAKEEYFRKSKMLLKSYIEAEKILTAACKEFPQLKTKVGDFKKHMEELKQSEFFLLVTGQTSAGKSVLINLLLGEDILPWGHLQVTSTICEIRYGEHPKIVAHSKRGPTTETFLKRPSEETNKSYHDQISPFVVHGKESPYEKVELFWPHPLLQNGVVIVDSPGIGDSDELDDVVYQYVPKVFASIYVISLANSHGIHKDTLGKLFKVVNNTYSVQERETEEKLAAASPFEEDMYGSGMSRYLQKRLLSKCALFLCNKKDQVKKKDVQRVEEGVVKNLTEMWPSVDCRSQLLFMSVENATIGREYGFATDSVLSLKRRMNGVITQGIDFRLEIKWRWLYDVLSSTIANTESSRKTTVQDQKGLKGKIQNYVHRLSYVRKNKDEIIKELRKKLEICKCDAVSRAKEYLSSEEVINQFTTWTNEDVPREGGNWSETEENIQRALSNRFNETLQHWVEDCELLLGAQQILQQVLEQYILHGKEHLEDVSDGSEEGTMPSSRQVKLGFGGVTAGGTFYALGFAWLMRQATSIALRLAVPTSLVVLSLSMDIFFFLRRQWCLKEFAEGKEAFMSKQSKNYLAYWTSRQVSQPFERHGKLSRCVKLLLEPLERYIDDIAIKFPKLIEAEEERLRKLKNDERSLEEVKDAYAKINEDGCQQRSDLAFLGLTEMCSIRISGEALECKLDISSRLGSGTFGDVYPGKMKQDGETKNVALKVSKEKLNKKNASEIMDEIELLRTLNGHRRIVHFFGISLPDNFSALVLEKCEGSLADYIFQDEKEKKQSVPGTSKNLPLGIPKKCQWAREITDGLAFIHAKKVVHRDLKPENILVSEENSIKIADVGLAKPAEIITGTVAGTYTYMAPEVFDSKLYNEKVDVYSLAIILWEMWHGKRAYRWRGTIAEFFRWLKDGNRPENEGGCNEPPWNDLMKQCWSSNPENRPTARECKSEIGRISSLK